MKCPKYYSLAETNVVSTTVYSTRFSSEEFIYDQLSYEEFSDSQNVEMPFDTIDFEVHTLVYVYENMGTGTDFRDQCYYCLAENFSEVIVKLDTSLDDCSQYGGGTMRKIYWLLVPKIYGNQISVKRTRK